MAFKSEGELFAAIRKELYTAVVGDIMDEMGHRCHFLPPQVQALRSDMVVVGRAMPVVVQDVKGRTQDRFGRMLEALDALREHDVYITNGGDHPYALWGELLATRATKLKAAGAVMNGYCRDSAGILEIGFPTFSWGTYALDISYRGLVTDYNVPTVVGEVHVRPGDIVFGDRDGVTIVPQNMAEEVFEKALAKVRSENLVRDAFREGMSAVDAFARFGVM